MNFNEYPNWRHLNTTSGYAGYYAKRLPMCQEWKRLRPDGEIHYLCYYHWRTSEPSKELVSLFTTCNAYLHDYDDNDDDYASEVYAIRQHWPQFADSILSDEAKLKYPK